MDQLTLKPRKAAVEEPIESWDDDDLEIGENDFTFRSASLVTAASNPRDSISSRLSIRSDFESIQGDEERQVHVPGDDERSTIDAIAQAKKAGIPIPQNVPTSALLGGTIKRLGGRRIQRIIRDDWDDGDLELPGSGSLQLKKQDGSNFPDALRQVSAGSTQASPIKMLQAAPTFRFEQRRELKPKPASSNLLLDRYRDQDDDDDFFDGGETIKVAKSRPGPKLLPLITPPTPQQGAPATARDDDFEHDFQFPADGRPLRLTTRKAIPKTPSNLQDEFDEWAEGGSLGTRHGGTRRDARSNRSSSASALSPSIASSITVESEDEGLDGLILPSGPINFEDILKRRQQDRSPDPQSVETPTVEKPVIKKQTAVKQTGEKQAPKRVEIDDDFLTGLEIGDGDVFSSKNLPSNRNIKVKPARQTSPSRPKTSISLTFTNKPTQPAAPVSRLPRPLGGHERTSSCLEPVSESGGPITRTVRRSQSRVGGHSSQSSIASMPTPTTTNGHFSLGQPATPRRRDLGTKTSFAGLRQEPPTTTNAQLLKMKRSMPTMKALTQSPAKPMFSRFERPPSRTDGGRSLSISRPKTPLERDRSGAESSMSHARKNPVPFLPAGASNYQSQHATIKTTRHFRRNDSESSTNSSEFRPSSRTMSRAALRSPSPRRKGLEVLARSTTTKQQLTKPVRRKPFGEGFELDGFDDLPTSKDSESKFVKEPVGRGPPKLNSLRHKVHQEFHPPRTTTPAPATPYTMHSAQKSRDDLPRFARDTTASRMAREYSLAQRNPSGSGNPLAPIANQWKNKAVTGVSTIHAQPVKPKKIKGPPKKPQLIKALGSTNNPKSVKGMYYNPYKFRWEGNDNDVATFDPPASSPSTASVPSHVYQEKDGPHQYREKANTTPRPALIKNVNSGQVAQIVGGMVFDPQRFRWLKIDPPQEENGKSEAGDTMDGFNALDEEEDDVFKDVPDLQDKPGKEGSEIGARKSEGASGLNDEWLIGEEFDVGPEFIRRQREEEERWRRKTEKWINPNRGEEWRWLIRDVVNEL